MERILRNKGLFWPAFVHVEHIESVQGFFQPSVVINLIAMAPELNVKIPSTVVQSLPFAVLVLLITEVEAAPIFPLPFHVDRSRTRWA